jgi:hypothetical protein
MSYDGLGVINVRFAGYRSCWADEFVPAAYVPVLTIRTQSSNVGYGGSA